MKVAPARAPGAKADAASSLLDGVAQLAFVLQGTLERVAAQSELSLVQLRLLGILRDREPGMLELAKYLGLDKSSITGLVDRAQKRDLVQRKTTPTDGRAVRVALTEHGRAVIASVETQAHAELNALLEPLTKADRKQLSELVTRILTHDAQRRLSNEQD